tara:strand:- start:706 stop:1338 length:633 start_codon:yes stop_codon:yes gene_type:complete
MTLKVKVLFISLIFFSSLNIQAQWQWTPKDVRIWKKEMNKSFKSKKESPLKLKDRRKFRKLPFFCIDKNFAIKCLWERNSDSSWFEMLTTTERKPIYRKYATLYFMIEGKKFRLTAFQPKKLSKKEGFQDYLFVPFGDNSNGDETYGGGRFVEIRMNSSDEKFLLLDFNKSYNPYCAYSERYSCPKIPLENILDTRINAGVKYNLNKYHH